VSWPPYPLVNTPLKVADIWLQLVQRESKSEQVFELTCR